MYPITSTDKVLIEQLPIIIQIKNCLLFLNNFYLFKYHLNKILVVTLIRFNLFEMLVK